MSIILKFFEKIILNEHKKIKNNILKEPNNKETNNKEPDNKETDNKEPNNKETNNKETNNKETDNKEPNNKETNNKEPNNKDANNKEPDNKETDIDKKFLVRIFIGITIFFIIGAISTNCFILYVRQKLLTQASIYGISNRLHIKITFIVLSVLILVLIALITFLYPFHNSYKL